MPGYRKAALAAALLYAVSLALPAYAGTPGFICVLTSVSHGLDQLTQNPLAAIYLTAFGVTNIFFFVLLIRSFRGRIAAESRDMKIAWALLAHVVSWWVLNLIPVDFLGIKRILAQLGPGVRVRENVPVMIDWVEGGYYVWLAAFVMLLIAVRSVSATAGSRSSSLSPR